MTITPSTSTIDGNPTLVISQGQNCTIWSPDNTNYLSRCASGQLVAGTNVTLTPSADGVTISSSGGGGSSGVLCGELGYISGSIFANCGQFLSTPFAIATNQFPDSGMTWYLSSISGTAALTQGAAATDTQTGHWYVESGSTSGNESALAAVSGYTVSGIYPPATSTTKTLYIRFQLGTDANDRHVIGWFEATNNGYSSDPTANNVGFWCQVTDSASPGNYGCFMQIFSGGFHLTTMTTAAVTADTSAHILKAVYNTTELDMYLDGTKIACTNSGGTGGCTAWNTAMETTTPVSPMVDSKTSAAAAAITIFDKVAASW